MFKHFVNRLQRDIRKRVVERYDMTKAKWVVRVRLSHSFVSSIVLPLW
jgi:hypothetical protein